MENKLKAKEIVANQNSTENKHNFAANEEKAERLRNEISQMKKLIQNKLLRGSTA
jgi:hypothetical protein